jgi:ABC-type molybdate transport system substrate-binding protein
MRFAAIAAALFLMPVAAQGADLRILSPGIVYNAALYDLVADYNKKTGNNAIIIRGAMNKIVDEIKTATPPADVIGLPVDLMNTLVLDGGIVAGSYTLLGRGDLGLAVKKGAAKPDISTVAKLADVLKASPAVMVNDPKAGTMQGVMIDGILKRPEFSGVKAVPIELVAPLPAELGGHMDAVLAVSSRSTNPKLAMDFIKFLTSTESRAAWKAKGMRPF